MVAVIVFYKLLGACNTGKVGQNTLLLFSEQIFSLQIIFNIFWVTKTKGGCVFSNWESTLHS